MKLDLISLFRATANKDPEYNVQIKSNYPIRNTPYKPEYGGGDSFEIFERNIIVTVTFINNLKQSYNCDRVIEEFDKLLLIKNGNQIEFDLKDVESIRVE